MNFEGFLEQQQNFGPHFTAGVQARGTRGPAETADKNADPTKHKKPSNTAAILGEALLWPMYLAPRDTSLPAIAFGVSAFLGMPFFYPLTSVGGSLLASYGVGSVVYLAKVAGDPPISQIKGNPA